MPAYSTTNPVTALYPGNKLVLCKPSADGNSITATVQFSLAVSPGGPSLLAFHNSTGQTATIQVAAVDADANYLALKDADTTNAITVATNSSIVCTCIGPFARCNFSVSPNSGALTVSR